MQGLMIFLGAILVVIGTTIFRGLTLSVLWGWFIVPLGVVSIGIPMAIGIAMIIGFVTYQDVTTKDRSLGEAFGISIFQCLFALAVGYILTLFM